MIGVDRRVGIVGYMYGQIAVSSNAVEGCEFPAPQEDTFRIPTSERIERDIFDRCAGHINDFNSDFLVLVRSLDGEARQVGIEHFYRALAEFKEGFGRRRSKAENRRLLASADDARSIVRDRDGVRDWIDARWETQFDASRSRWLV